MNANPPTWSRLMAALLSTVLPSAASVAVISNLEQAGQAAAVLRDSGGALLPVGCAASLVTFPGKSDAEVLALASSGLGTLQAAAVAFGDPATVGAGSDEAGSFEFQSGAPLAAPLQEVHLLVTTATADELLLLKFTQAIPADNLAGPDGHIAIHLDDGEVVYGSRDASGFVTAVSPVVTEPTPFQAWILSELGEETPAADLLPEADADQDGVANLMEYAAGTDPGDGGSRVQVRLRRSAEGTHFFQYLRRTSDAALVYTAERLLNSGAGPWIALEEPPVAPAEAPSPAPASFEWVEQPLPSGASGFARLRVELVE